jgi:F-type H+-transporting ATPase subunit delta
MNGAAMLSATYARALLRWAASLGRENELVAPLQRMAAVLDHPQGQAFVTHPFITHEKKMGALKSWCAGSWNDLLEQFLHLVLEKRRGGALKEMIAAYFSALKEHQGIRVVKLTAYSELSPSQREALKSSLGGIFEQEIELEEAQDASLLAGAVIESGHFRIDGSLRHHMNLLRKAMLTEN